MSTISTTITHGITLSTTGTYASPLTITASGAVEASGITAIYGPAGYAWTVANYGTIAASGSLGVGVYLKAGGSVVNGSTSDATALIQGVSDGVAIGGAAGTVINSATIRGTGINSEGIFIGAGGSALIVNARSGLISGGSNGILLGDTAATVSNSGTIRGLQTTGNGIGIYLGAGGSAVIVNAQSGLVSDAFVGIGIVGGNGTVSNSGTIQGANVDGIFLAAGSGSAAITNAQAGLISGGLDGVALFGTAGVSNSGTIAGIAGTLYNSDGIYLSAKGSAAVTNAQSGLVSGGRSAVAMLSAADTVSNFGTIRGSADGILLSAGTVSNGSTGVTTALIQGADEGVAIVGAAGTVSNYGTILSTISEISIGIFLENLGGAAVINNGPSGLISGGYGGVDAFNTTYAATISNSGKIQGVALVNGAITNGPNGLITSGATGVAVVIGNVGTVSNFGTIHGYSEGIRFESGAITNGSSGLISGAYGVDIFSGNVTVSNFGTILGTPAPAKLAYGDDGVLLFGNSKASVINGSTGVTTALIQGVANGVAINAAAATVSNYGTIQGTGINSDGISLGARGSAVIINARSGLISGGLYGIAVGAATATVSNFGTIEGGTAGAGIAINATGTSTVFNGATNATSALISGGREGVRDLSQTGTVVNYGTVIATASNGVGIYLTLGTVTNFGTVIAGANAIGIAAFGGSITNYGAIIAPTAAAVIVRHATFINQGVVRGSVYGVEFGLTGTGGGTGKITASGTVSGTVGIGAAPGITAGYTVTVGGTVMSTVGSAGTAVSLGGLTGRLIVDPDAAFTGIVNGGGGASVLEIAASGPGVAGADAGAGDGTAAITGTISLGGVTNFSALQVDFSAAVDAGGNLIFDTLVNQGQINLAAGDSLVVGTVANSANGGTIDLRSGGSVHFTGAVAAGQTVLFRPPGGSVLLDHPEQFAAALTQFDMTDTIDLPLGQATFQQYAGGVLSLSYGGGTVALQLTTISATPQFIFTGDGHGGTDITVNDTTCFCRGTHILTDRGEVAVEELAVGDRVRTLSGAVKPIVWIGIGRGLVTRKNRLARPIIVRRGALADNVPHRDLYLTHGHALYFASAMGGVLIPVEHLVNHRSILWDEADRVVEYYHIELEDHHVLLAEGAPAESYYDADNRALFHHTRPGSQPGAATTTCAPVQNGGELVESVWARLYARAGGTPGGKPEREVTADPDLHLVIDRERIDPAALGCGVYRFAVARPPVDRMLLRSRCGVPSLLGLGRSDHRPLGVAIQKIVWHHAGIASCFDYDQPQLREGGCYKPEDGFCWTDGELQLPGRFFTLLNGAFTLVVHTQPHPEMRYPIAVPLAGEARQAA